jgi:hypothetical protein
MAKKNIQEHAIRVKRRDSDLASTRFRRFQGHGTLRGASARPLPRAMRVAIVHSGEI